MPSLPALLSPTASAPRPYSPLPNTGDAPANSPRPSSATRVASTSSVASSDEDSRGGAAMESPLTGYTSITRATTLASDETLDARTLNGAAGEEGDIGEVRRGENGYGYKAGKIDVKGKGRQQPWDVEQGKVEEIYAGVGEYPPTNEEEDEERRIQQNLARMAARDQARRRASRQSKMLVPTASPDLAAEGFSSSTSYGRPGSMMSMNGKRTSFLGIVDGLWGGGHRQPSSTTPIEEEREPPFVPPDMPPDSTQLIANPYATRPAPFSPPLNHTPPPGVIISPASPDDQTRINPFEDPSTPKGSAAVQKHQRNDSSASTIQATSPTSPASPTETMQYGYAGPGWRGGANAANGSVQNVEKPEKWWHSFCAWGRDLDGDEEDGENQAGRTNPFE